ncbi:hypothetical protein CWO90_41640 [Bradyrhizobium sp. Leo121]|nr:hypothetical protein CWO90_41640 [Bradyrhizobium sp. Leo121]
MTSIGCDLLRSSVTHVRVIHPIFYPVEQHDRAVHRRNQAKMTEVARKAWHAFVKLRFWSSL